MAKRYIDPHIVNVSLDACAFDPKYFPEDKASTELFQLSENEELNLIIAYTTAKEISHPNTPQWVKDEASMRITTMEVQLNPHEKATKQKILRFLTGNGKQENNVQDAHNVFEAGKYGGYFVTTDSNILKKKEEIEKICSVCIVKPSELMAIYDEYANT